VTTFTVAHHQNECDGGFTPPELLRFGRRKSVIGLLGSVVQSLSLICNFGRGSKKQVEFCQSFPARPAPKTRSSSRHESTQVLTGLVEAFAADEGCLHSHHSILGLRCMHAA